MYSVAILQIAKQAAKNLFL